MISDREMNRIKSINRKNEYCLTLPQLKALSKQHQAARAAGDAHKMELIEYRLTDINFHHECGLLIQGFYDEIEAITEW